MTLGVDIIVLVGYGVVRALEITLEWNSINFGSWQNMKIRAGHLSIRLVFMSPSDMEHEVLRFRGD